VPQANATDVKIQLATASDAADIAALSRTAIEHGLPWRWTTARVAASIADRATNVVVARDGPVLIGFGIMKYHDEAAHLLLFAVAPTHRRRGLGTQLLHWLEKVALAAGLQRIGLEARADNAEALAFYRRHGYVERALVPGMYLGVGDGVRLDKPLLGG
jgi:ribosomal-protein-alanine N-acetyltransferase